MKKVLTTAIGTGIIALFISAQIGFAALTASESEASPVVSVEPAYQTVSKGENFTVSIYVDPKGREVYGASYHLYFDNSLLNATLQTKGPFLGDDTIEMVNEINNTFNSTHGQIKYGETRKLPDTTGVTEPGILANISFEAIAEENGISELWLDNVKLYDPGGNKIENVTVNHGNVSVRVGICGDVDGSKRVDMADYFLLVDYIAEVPGRTLESEWAGDVDCSGKVDMADYFLLVDYIAEVPGRELNCC